MLSHTKRKESVAEGTPGLARTVLEWWRLCLLCFILDFHPERELFPVFLSRTLEGASSARPYASPSPSMCARSDAPPRNQGTGSGPAAHSPVPKLAGPSPWPAGDSHGRAFPRDEQVGTWGGDSWARWQKDSMRAPRVTLLLQHLVRKPRKACCGVSWRASPVAGPRGECERRRLFLPDSLCLFPELCSWRVGCTILLIPQAAKPGRNNL